MARLLVLLVVAGAVVACDDDGPAAPGITVGEFRGTYTDATNCFEPGGGGSAVLWVLGLEGNTLTLAFELDPSSSSTPEQADTFEATLNGNSFTGYEVRGDDLDLESELTGTLSGETITGRWTEYLTDCEDIWPFEVTLVR